MCMHLNTGQDFVLGKLSSHSEFHVVMSLSKSKASLLMLDVIDMSHVTKYIYLKSCRRAVTFAVGGHTGISLYCYAFGEMLSPVMSAPGCP